MADDDLTAFVEACREFKQSISIRGSTAYVLSRDTDSDSRVKGSIVESVPPLGDLDLIIHDHQPAEALRRVGDVLERYRTYVPASRFIHVDVFYEHLPVREDSPLGNVVIKGLPEVSIGGDANPSVTPSFQDAPIQASVASRVLLAALFRDFLFLLRLSQRHKALDNTTDQVAKLLRRWDPREVGFATRVTGGAQELARIDKALVKHVLLRGPEQEPTPMTEYLPTHWLLRFASYLNRISQAIILQEEHWQRTRAIAYAVNGRMTRFTEVTDLEDEEHELLEKKLPSQPEALMQRLTPSLKVLLPYPDAPECCEYRDFSKGISELVWRDSDERSLLNVSLMEGTEKYYAVHAQASEDFGARSLRTDPGFMGMLNHRALGAVRLMGVRA